MKDLILDFYGHQQWADAEVWKALEAHPASFQDDDIRKKLHHLHMVQSAYLAIVTNAEWTRKKLEEFASMLELKAYGIAHHALWMKFLPQITEEKLNEKAIIPWFRNSPVDITIGQAIIQASMHSHYHRGQITMRLRQLGGEPPTTDFVAWYMKRKPEPGW
jgi:uncharacterized damage-inducible protein DinB